MQLSFTLQRIAEECRDMRLDIELLQSGYAWNVAEMYAFHAAHKNLAFGDKMMQRLTVIVRHRHQAGGACCSSNAIATQMGYTR